MQYTGRFQVAFRGPAGVMRTLPDTVETWGHLLSGNYMNEDVREEINDVAGILCRKADTMAQKREDEIVMVVWEHLSPLALVLLDCINGIARAYPVLEIAVALELNFSVSDSVGYYSYYSAAGENTICPARAGTDAEGLQDFLNAENQAKGELDVLLQYKGADGSGHLVNLWDVDNVLDIPIGSNGLSGCSESDVHMAFEEGLLFLLRCDIDGIWTYITPDDEIAERYEEARWDDECEDELADIFQLLTLSDAGKSVAWRGAAEELTEGLQQVYPDIAFCVKQLGKQLLLSDEEGNEYYFGGNITIKNVYENIAWGFPSSADWVPFRKMGICETNDEGDKDDIPILSKALDRRKLEAEMGRPFDQVDRVVVPGSTFVLTGRFWHCGDDREKIQALIVEKGGRSTGSVSGKTTYLVIGDLGDFGARKIEQVEQQNAKGKNIKIIREEDLFQVLECGE